MWPFKSRQPPPPPELPEPPRHIIFGEVPVPYMLETITYQGFEIYADYQDSKVKNICSSCGGDVEFDNYRQWEEIVSKTWTCGECIWLQQKFKLNVDETTEAIQTLEGLHEKLFDALERFLGEKPDSLKSGDLKKAGLILHRERASDVLGFVLIDYTREQMHELVTTINGRLEPFSRGFKLLLPLTYYQLFPGSYNYARKVEWGWHSDGPLYSGSEGGSHLDWLLKHKETIESKAEKIRARIAAKHAAQATTA